MNDLSQYICWPMLAIMATASYLVLQFIPKEWKIKGIDYLVPMVTGGILIAMKKLFYIEHEPQESLLLTFLLTAAFHRNIILFIKKKIKK